MNTKHIVSGIALTSMMAIGGVAHAENPFSAKCMQNGYQNSTECKKADAKCGEGKCGGATTNTKKADAKCGEGKCGGATSSKKSEAKCGEGKCGGSH